MSSQPGHFRWINDRQSSLLCGLNPLEALRICKAWRSFLLTLCTMTCMDTAHECVMLSSRSHRGYIWRVSKKYLDKISCSSQSRNTLTFLKKSQQSGFLRSGCNNHDIHPSLETTFRHTPTKSVSSNENCFIPLPKLYLGNDKVPLSKSFYWQNSSSNTNCSI